MKEGLPEILGGFIGFLFLLAYRGIIIAAAIKYLSH